MLQYEVSQFEPLPRTIQPHPDWGEFFGYDSGFCIRLTEKYFMSVFLDRRLTGGSDCDRFLLIQEPESVVAHCVSCVGEFWQVRAEPTAPGGLGLVVYTNKGKALAAGEARIEEGELEFTLKTLYEGMTNKIKITYETNVKITTKPGGEPEYTGTVGVKVEDSR